ncbi:hypothetical protein SBA7_1160003 [Candidatus Sulfotelmatobacter sp. SbA7]|nr:hypothetical protein SBA7_1160003 [Candidatus Sulfotelmatobacter sp. SbA7]
MAKGASMRARIRDTQIIELIGRNRLGSELLRDGLEIAVPARDRGIDLIAYADLSARVRKFRARPIQMKAASERSFSIDRKYEKVANLIIAYVWNIHDPGTAVTYALTYQEALIVAKKCWARARSTSWKRGRYSTSNPSRKLRGLLGPYRMKEGDWWEKVTGTKYQTTWG